MDTLGLTDRHPDGSVIQSVEAVVGDHVAELLGDGSARWGVVVESKGWAVAYRDDDGRERWARSKRIGCVLRPAKAATAPKS
jgi:hypothetical protein